MRFRWYSSAVEIVVLKNRDLKDGDFDIVGSKKTYRTMVLIPKMEIEKLIHSRQTGTMFEVSVEEVCFALLDCSSTITILAYIPNI